MRRVFCLVLVLIFTSGPLVAGLQADDYRLPPCCRRNGAHHCSMSDAMILRMIALFHGKPFLNKPAHCPFYPHNAVNTFGPAFRLALPAAPPAYLRAQVHEPIPYRAITLAARLRSHSGLSPPISRSI